MSNVVQIADLDTNIADLNSIVGGGIKVFHNGPWNHYRTTASKVGRRFLKGKWRTKWCVRKYYKRTQYGVKKYCIYR